MKQIHKTVCIYSKDKQRGERHLLTHDDDVTQLRKQVLDSLLVLCIVSIDGKLLEELSEFISDGEAVYIALQNNGLALEFATDNLRCISNVIRCAIKENPQALWKADEFMHSHHDFR